MLTHVVLALAFANVTSAAMTVEAGQRGARFEILRGHGDLRSRKVAVSSKIERIGNGESRWNKIEAVPFLAREAQMMTKGDLAEEYRLAAEAFRHEAANCPHPEERELLEAQANWCEKRYAAVVKREPA